jgi:hypothetical protein
LPFDHISGLPECAIESAGLVATFMAARSQATEKGPHTTIALAGWVMSTGEPSDDGSVEQRRAYEGVSGRKKRGQRIGAGTDKM